MYVHTGNTFLILVLFIRKKSFVFRIYYIVTWLFCKLNYIYLMFRGNEPFYFNSADGLLAIGGYLGSTSFSGFLGPLKLYQNILMKMHYALKYISPIREMLNKLDLSIYIVNCANLKHTVYRHVLGLSTVHGVCPVQHWWHKMKQTIRPKVRKFDKDVDGKLLPDYFLRKLQAALKENPSAGVVYSLQEYSKILYERTMRNLVS